MSSTVQATLDVDGAAGPRTRALRAAAENLEQVEKALLDFQARLPAFVSMVQTARAALLAAGED